jgi:predicted nucleic acid-binding protein
MYVDANVFIFARFNTDHKGVRARRLLESIPPGEQAVTSVLALDEIMWVMQKNKFGTKVREVIEDIYHMQNVVVKPVADHIPLDALNYVEAYSLKPRDAFHAALMRELGEDTIVSDDKDFDKIKGIKRIKL